MIKIWFKLETNHKIKKSEVLEYLDICNFENFCEIVKLACNKFDVPTPVILSTHFFDYINFNSVNFLPRDFVESFPFSKLVLENAAE